MDEDTQGKVEGVAMNVYEKLPEIPKKDRVWYMTTENGIMRDGDIALMVDGKCYRGSREELRKHCKKELKQFLRDMRNCEGGRGKPHACPICGKVIFDDDDVYCEKHHEEGRRITRAQVMNASEDEIAKFAAAIVSAEMTAYRGNLERVARSIGWPDRSIVEAWDKDPDVKAYERYIRSKDFSILTMNAVDPEVVIKDFRRDALHENIEFRRKV